MLSSRSRFNNATLIVMLDDRGHTIRRPYLDRLRRLRVRQYIDDSEYRPVAGDTWQNIAFRAYGDARLWWILCEWNNVVDPWTELKSIIAGGKTIRFPSVSRVNLEILSFRGDST